MSDTSAVPRGTLSATRMGATPWAMPPDAPDPGDEAPRSTAGATLASWNEAETTKLARARMALRLAGGVTSLALVAGLGFWGHKLMLREVLGLPVVAAAEGPMRVEPAEPGGTVAADMGLSVNGVPAAGGAAAPSDVLLLAPDVPGLAPEDMVIQTSAEAAEPRLDADAPADAPADRLGTPVLPTIAPGDVTGVVATAAASPTITARPLSPEEILAFADSMAAGAAPLATLAAASADAAAAPVVEAVAAAAAPTTLRPVARPGGATLAASAATSAATPPAEAPPEPPVLTASIAPGTALVQLGAFDSPDVAAAEWERISAAYPDFLGSRERVIQEAVSGGQTFYRLRATGFEDLPDARRLCAVLDAEGQGCVTYVVP